MITHEHSDHIHGVGVLARKYGMDLTLMKRPGRPWKIVGILARLIPQKHISLKWQNQNLGDIDIESFG